MANKRPSRWERASFDVPATVPDEVVQTKAGVYMARFGQHLERQGFIVLDILRPVVADSTDHKLFSQPDRRRYHIFALVTREPRTVSYDIPDYAVPQMQKVGLSLQE